MKKLLRRQSFLVCFGFLVSTNVYSQRPVNAGGYNVFENYLQPGRDVNLGQVSGLAIDKNDNLYVLHRAGRVWDLETREPLASPVVLKFSDKGKLIGSLGGGMFTLPHMIEVDPSGNIWIVDVSMQQLFKLAPDGKLLLQLGEKFVTGDDSAHFNLPTDVSVLNDGFFYLSDGYRNSRVIKYSKEGKYLFQWGEKGEGNGQLRIPHSVKVDGQHVLVADRENSRLQVFDLKGKFISGMNVGDRIGRLFSLTVGRDGKIYLSGMKQEGGGTLVLSPELKIIAELATGGHDVAVDSKGVIYVAKGCNVVRFTPE